MGRYKGVNYIRHRICDVLCVDSVARWYFAYVGGVATGDHFRTITDFKNWVDNEY